MIQVTGGKRNRKVEAHKLIKEEYRPCRRRLRLDAAGMALDGILESAKFGLLQILNFLDPSTTDYLETEGRDEPQSMII